jgi:hypothetical protein
MEFDYPSAIEEAHTSRIQASSVTSILNCRQNKPGLLLHNIVGTGQRLSELLDLKNEMVARKLERFKTTGVPFLHSKGFFSHERGTQARLWTLLARLARVAPSAFEWHKGRDKIDSSLAPFMCLPPELCSSGPCPHVILITTFSHNALSFDVSVNKEIKCVWCGSTFLELPAKFLFGVDITPFPAYPISFTKVFAEGCIIKLEPDCALSARAHLPIP